MFRIQSKRTAWTRVWTGTLRGSLEEGLAMRMADPAWMLARQYQMGAFIGDDSASPARVELTHAALDVSHVAPLDGGSWAQIEAEVPLEAQTEPLPTAATPAALLLQARAGRQFLRLFPEVGRREATEVLGKGFRFSKRDIDAVADHPTVATLLRDGLDGQKVLRKLDEAVAGMADASGIDDPTREQRAEAWKAYAEHRFRAPKRGGCWRDPELSYGMRTRSRSGGNRRIELRAEAHDGGRLDWFSFDIDPASPGTAKALGQSRTKAVYPTPVRYAGMPADTLWDFEDAAVHFGGLSAERTDLAQLLLTEFATVFSNDWFLVPFRADTGTLQRVVSIKVWDTYGEHVTLSSTAVADGAGRPNRWFELSGDGSAEDASTPRTPWLYLPRVVSSVEEGRTLERVVFSRDEAANLAWGIETTVETPAGRPRDRGQEWARVRDAFTAYLGSSDMPEPDPEAEAWVYRLLTGTAPPHWTPMIPEIENDMPIGRLRRARLQDWDLLGPDKDKIAGPQGQLMAPDKPFSVNDEEVLQGGTEITTAFQSARGPDGRLHVWLARRRRPAERVEPAGRLTDVIERGRKT